MKKTNIRLKNYFVIEDKKKFFLSSINDMNKWKNINISDIESYKEENITEKLDELMKKYQIYSNVNFFVEEEKKTINVSQKGGG